MNHKPQIISVFSAVMTGQGVGAIATIAVFGELAEDVIKKIFKPARSKTGKFEPGRIYLGTISDGVEIIDQVTIGCEGAGNFAIHCHGNPLIISDIMRLLQLHGAALLTAEELSAKILGAEKGINTIALEARLAQSKAKTVQGTKIIVNQIDAGLNKRIAEWQKNIDTTSLEKTRSHARRILENSQTAKLIIDGCMAVLIGPPNTGKSTLLNYLAGRQKAIVTDIKGTTRDWVSARCQINSLSLELIDTAGLDNKLPPENVIDKASRRKSIQILEKADLVLLVLDNSQTIDQLDGGLIEKITDKRTLTVLNKSDLGARLDSSRLPDDLAQRVTISAKLGIGIEALIDKIRQLCGVSGFDLQTEVCFTGRQEKLLRQLSGVKSKKQAVPIITELLNGRVCV